MDGQPEIAKGLNSPELKRNKEIPFVDDFIELDHVKPGEPIRPKRQTKEIHAADLGEVHSSPDSDTIVVNTPEGTLYITLEPDSSKSSRVNSPSTQSTDLTSPSTSKAAEESMALIQNEKDVEAEQRRTNLRRNSISMPTLQNLELEVLRQQYLQNPQDQIPEHHQSSASAFSDGDTQADHNETDDDRAKAPLRSPRRKRRGRSEFSMDDEDYSPNNSVVSVNSLASLLREKLQSIPQKIRKKPTDYKLRAFVGLMFLAVVFFVGFAYVLYHQQASSQAYFDAVQFNEPKRLLRIHSADDNEILRASLAVNLPAKQKAFPCLPAHRRPGSECLEWQQSARFYLKCLPHDPGLDNTTCYSVEWQALRHDVYPTDCFDWSDTKTNWYGGGQAANLSWPLNNGTIDFTPFITGNIQKSQFGNVLTRYLINSKGAAVIIDEETPLHIAINKGIKQICIKAQHDNFAYANKLTEFPEMKYNICTSRDMKSLHSSIHNHQRAPLWDGLKPADMLTLESLITEPVWQIAPRFKHELQAETISKYTEDVINLGFLKQGHVLINEFWQNEIGDLTVDTSRFETLNITVDKLHRRGFKVAFTIQPFISTESKNFAECVQKRLLVSERESDRRIPALTRFKSLASAGMLDITNNRTVPWFTEKIQAVIDKYHIDSFYLDLGTAYAMPMYYQCEKRLINPDQYKTIFTKTFEKSLNIIGVSGAVSLPRPPIFVSLPPFESSWEALRSVIPTMLTYGISGYPFIMPGAVGGDIYWPGSEQFLPSSKGLLESNATSTETKKLPEVELYMRWLQMATFLPVMKFTHLPSKYNDEKVLEMAKNLTVLRQKTITPLLLKYKREALEEGLPLIRPLWLVTGGDPLLVVKDEFAIGDDIVVAPVLYPGQTTREVYLPAGLWEDGIDGSMRKGSRWMHEYRVPINRVAYFKRLPSDLRFR
ncbi:myogenesis-regulating glycosidase isoform X1 [Cydia pomonella]|uniref:myogenesis-regulating glycosidase isoform X1 n=1 Tax=Cydia pomonella TaxID=82600 RepID=UPI002ADDFB6C|nr:myogenesis-regulating glycosidase isoform X1 [Cydia pomonella]XP_061720152.1 myogenesis-regulating glycosidase isoform X1 [Cydia pomonella]XP_061720153.1 myogenesis-regulating glycosidase isoform X1 [Cydia pomonella]XP_061720154.1 myogenesis-regulating glycosidase isoform X1 [Cydia pomonella]XP_061720156.1 myogenesis-regulating glycosidase isoform X1 [Cydia pomonella]XP_061720157.1 myogenesis-regulating glycosidase isoform X1 [Cydia pomonella]XP_061720158.1 myogenesis-regulating glycosidas